MRLVGSPQQLEKRRLRAISLLESGKTYREAAHIVGASLSSIVVWTQAYRQEGVAGLQSKPTPGRPPALAEREKVKLEKILLKGPLKAGYSTDLWTLKRIAEVIARRFQVSYHPCHVWKVLKAMEWSCQKPERRALQRDEETIRKWQRYKWPRIKKSSGPECPSGFP